MNQELIGTFIKTNEIPQVDKIREFFLRGIAATFPLSTKEHVLRWMITQQLAFHPTVCLGVYDDLIQAGLIRRAYKQTRCKCNTVEVYKLTDLGFEMLKSLLHPSLCFGEPERL